MKLFNFKSEKRALEPVDPLAKILSGEETTQEVIITKEIALQIPSVKAAIGLIADIISSLEIKLYRDLGNEVEELTNDYRLKLLNDDTGDMLDSKQMIESLIADYLLLGNGYIYINMIGSNIKSLHYLEPHVVQKINGVDPIFKDSKILIQGKYYNPWEFVILLQNTVDGVSGKGLIADVPKLLELAYNTQDYSNEVIRAGGVKRGVITSSKKIGLEALNTLKEKWANFYRNISGNQIMILNEGLNYQELSGTSADLQLLENRNKNDDDILRILKVPKSILDGTATNDVYNQFIKTTIIPIIEKLQNSFNKSLLLSSESDFYFAYDTTGLQRGNMEERIKALKEAVDGGILTVNEARYIENYKPFEGMDILKLNLANVLYNVKTKEIYTPNTNSTVKVDDLKGGESNESGN